jgi:hypothetical protein
MFKRGCDRTDLSINVDELVSQLKSGKIKMDAISKLFWEDKLSAVDYGKICFAVEGDHLECCGNVGSPLPETMIRRELVEGQPPPAKMELN